MSRLRAATPEAVKIVLRPPYHGAIGLARLGVRAFHKCLRVLMGARGSLRLHHFLSEGADRTVRVGGIVFDATDPIPYWRGVTSLTKEPDTIEWLNTYVDAGDVFYDIGANIGVFSLYAAKQRKAKVLAFEPAAENFAVLNRNIHMNGLDGAITALNIAAHNSTKLEYLNLSAVMPGKAGNSFAINVGGSDMAEYEPEYRQGMLGFRLDDLITQFGLPVPNHIKIDVDGNDPLVLEGMGRFIDDRRLRSVAIELRPERNEADRAVITFLREKGFALLESNRFRNQAYVDAGLAYNHFMVRGPQG